MSNLPTKEQAEKWLDKCVHCGCSEWNDYCHCVIDCHGMAAIKVLKEKFQEGEK